MTMSLSSLILSCVLVSAPQEGVANDTRDVNELAGEVERRYLRLVSLMGKLLGDIDESEATGRMRRIGLAGRVSRKPENSAGSVDDFVVWHG